MELKKELKYRVKLFRYSNRLAINKTKLIKWRITNAHKNVSMDKQFVITLNQLNYQFNYYKIIQLCIQ